MRLQTTMGKSRIARKKAWATIKIALTIAFIADLNAGIEYLKVLPPKVWTFENVAQAREIDPQQGEDTPNEAKAALEPQNAPESEIQGEFTAYTADPGETDSDPRTMASGKEVYKGAIACPSKYAHGTKISIKGMGTYTCEDRMAERFRNSEHFDIYMETKEEAFSFGRQTIAYALTK